MLPPVSLMQRLDSTSNPALVAEWNFLGNPQDFSKSMVLCFFLSPPGSSLRGPYGGPQVMQEQRSTRLLPGAGTPCGSLAKLAWLGLGFQGFLMDFTRILQGD